MPKTQNVEPEWVFSHEHRKCSMDGCRAVITHFVYKKDDFDGRVWCRTHASQARKR